MKTFYASLMVASLAMITGCNVSTTGGTPGAGSFKLEGPATATTVKHSGQETVGIKVSEDKNFKEDITLSAVVDPDNKGVTATISPTVIKASDSKKAELTIKASDKAAPGDYNVIVTGKPTKGDSTNVTVKVKVPEKK